MNEAPETFELDDDQFTIEQAEWIAPKVRRIVVRAPRVSSHHKPGHFVIVRVHEGGERIPLTIGEWRGVNVLG